jgi:hypothetical protein
MSIPFPALTWLFLLDPTIALAFSFFITIDRTNIEPDLFHLDITRLSTELTFSPSFVLFSFPIFIVKGAPLVTIIKDCAAAVFFTLVFERENTF